MDSSYSLFRLIRFSKFLNSSYMFDDCLNMCKFSGPVRSESIEIVDSLVDAYSPPADETPGGLSAEAICEEMGAPLAKLSNDIGDLELDLSGTIQSSPVTPKQ